MAPGTFPQWDEMEWDEDSGLAIFVLEGSEVARRAQPTRPGHAGWSDAGQRPQTYLSME